MAQVLTHSGFDFLETYGIHEVPQRRAWETAIYRYQFPGVVGETHTIDNNKGRDIAVLVRYRGFETEAAMDAFLDALSEQQGMLRETLTIDGSSYENTTFELIEEIEPRFYDGSGIHGWTTKCLLRWRQREPNAPPDPGP